MQHARVVTPLCLLTCLGAGSLSAQERSLGAAPRRLVVAASVPVSLDTASYVKFYAEGSIRTAVEAKSGNPAGGAGALGIAYTNPHGLLVSAQITVASSLDTLRSGFGASVLVPSTAQGISGRLAVSKDLGKKRYGISGYAAVARASWLADTLAPESTTGVTVVALGLAGYTNIVQGMVGETTVRLSANLGPSLRLLAGDIATQDQVRKATIGSGRKAFGGLECGLSLAVGGVTGLLTVYYYGGEKVAGLTAGQASAALSVAAPWFEGRLDH